MSGHLLRFMQTAMSAAEAAWRPSADIYRTPKGWLVKFDVAGVKPEDVEVMVQGSRLIVRGMRRDSCLEEGCRCHHMEISYSQFERSLSLPCDLQTAQISAEHKDGMLLVRICMEDN